jgi:hypothetical protein
VGEGEKIGNPSKKTSRNTRTVAPKIITNQIGEIRAQTAFSAKPRIYPHIAPDQSLQGAQIAAQTRPNRRI